MLKEYEQAQTWKKIRRPKNQECFLNAQSYCIDDLSARYFEGYALLAGVSTPSEHAWVVTPDGAVVDFTLEAAEKNLKRVKFDCDTRSTLYFGLEIPTRLVMQRILTNQGIAESLLDWFLSLKA